MVMALHTLLSSWSIDPDPVGRDANECGELK
jgi:hypothetical protein